MYTYLAIGDSLTTGRGSTQGGFVPVYRQMVANQLYQPVQLTYIAKSGLTCSEVVRGSLNPANKKRIYSADLITITAGGNDLLAVLPLAQRSGSVEVLMETSRHILHCLHTLVENIHEIKKTSQRPYIIRIFSLYNPIIGVPPLDQQLSRFNRSLYSLEQYKSVQIVEIGSLFNGRQHELLSKDRIHPNDAGYAAMANAARRTGLYPL